MSMTRLRTARALGVRNILRVLFYRLRLRVGLVSVQRGHWPVPEEPFFRPADPEPAPANPWMDWREGASLFGWYSFNLEDSPPDWLRNPVNGQQFPRPERAWWRIGEFDPAFGDIKPLWELSRWDWLMAFAQQWRGGDQGAPERMNRWLADWLDANPPNRGPNWKCGQEASIRLLHLVLAAALTGDDQAPSSGLLGLIETHLRRIAPTVAYAIAQDNNHGTSEAAALFVGGSFLSRSGHAAGRRWERMGRRMLEERVVRLVGEQGTFSQYSVNYHRLMLDTLSVVEWWRRRCALPAFSAEFLERARMAALWLFAMTAPENGDAPNIGANDGALLLPGAGSGFRDFRPAVQLAMALFAERRPFPADSRCCDILKWLGLEVPQEPLETPAVWLATDGGFACLRSGNVLAVMRFPRFRFRPAHADALHVDLWIGGENLLRDGGTYSYHAADESAPDLASTARHNTVEFDGRDQMPRLSRFLFGDWLADAAVSPVEQTDDGYRFSAGYADSQGARHHRELRLGSSELDVVDLIEGFRKRAVLRWRLAPLDWVIEHVSPREAVLRGPRDLPMEIAVRSSTDWVDVRLVADQEARHYLQLSPVPVLELEVDRACSIETRMRWRAT